MSLKLKTQVRHAKHKLLTLYKSILDKMLGRKAPTNHILNVDSIYLQSIMGTAKINVHRGEQSWQYFIQAWTVLTVIFTEANGLYRRLDSHEASIAIVFADVLIISWLCFGSSWFRNYIVRVVNFRNSTPD